MAMAMVMVIVTVMTTYFYALGEAIVGDGLVIVSLEQIKKLLKPRLIVWLSHKTFDFAYSKLSNITFTSQMKQQITRRCPRENDGNGHYDMMTLTITVIMVMWMRQYRKAS